MKQFKYMILPIFTVALLLALGCSGNSGDKTAKVLDPQLFALSKPTHLTSGKEASNAMKEENVGSPTSEPDTEAVETGKPVKYKITLQKKSVSAEYDQCNVLKPDTDVIYPGSVIRGDSIDDGTYLEVTDGVKRPVNISFSLTGIKNGKVSGTIVPSLSAYQALHNEIMAQDIPGQASQTFQFESSEVSTEEALDLKISAGATYTSAITVDVKAGFNYSTTSKKKKILIRFYQTYYTVNLDQSGNKFLYENYDIASFNGYRPVYVASVAYGRVGFLSVETTLSKEDFDANLDIAVDTATVDATVNLSAAMKKLNETSSVKITLLGGSSTPTTLDGFTDEIRNGGFSENNRGVIVAYKLRFVDDNSIANTVFTGEYTARTVTGYTGTYNISMQITAARNNRTTTESIYGIVQYGSSTDYLFNRTSTNAYEMAPTNNTWTAVSSWPKVTQSFISTTDMVTVKAVNLKSIYLINGWDFVEGSVSKMVSQLVSGQSFSLTSNWAVGGQPDTANTNETLEFQITPTIDIVYNTTPD